MCLSYFRSVRYYMNPNELPNEFGLSYERDEMFERELTNELGLLKERELL